MGRPVTYRDSPEARNSTALAMARGSMKSTGNGCKTRRSCFPRGQGQMPPAGSSYSARSTVATGVRAARQAGPTAARLAAARADTTVPAIMIVEMTGWGTT